MGTNDDPKYENLLLTEYEYLTKMYISNEDLGEKRVNIFLGVASAALAIFGVILGIEIPLGEMIRIGSMLFAVVTVVLLLFGWITLKRIITRNIDTTGYVNRIDSIRRHYVKKNEEGKIRHLAFNPYKEPKIRGIDPGLRPLLSFNKGGLMENVVLMNSIVFVAFVISLAVAFVISLGWASAILEDFAMVLAFVILAVTVFIGIWIWQIDHVRKEYDAKIPERAAGGIVWRENNNTKAIAIIRRNRHGETKWTLPKGKLKEENGELESWKEAALREVSEEIGIVEADLTIGDFVDKNVYTTITEEKEEKIKAVYFWIVKAKCSYKTRERDKEVIEVEWLPIEEATKILEDDKLSEEKFEYSAEAKILKEALKRSKLK